MGFSIINETQEAEGVSEAKERCGLILSRGFRLTRFSCSFLPFPSLLSSLSVSLSPFSLPPSLPLSLHFTRHFRMNNNYKDYYMCLIFFSLFEYVFRINIFSSSFPFTPFHRCTPLPFFFTYSPSLHVSLRT